MASATASSNRRSSPKPVAAILALALLLALAAGGCGGGSDSSAGTSGGAAATDTASGSDSARPAAIVREESEAGDKSVQRYGAEAGGDERAAVIAAMRSFFRSLATSDYAKICAGLTASNRAQLQQFPELKHEAPADCPSILSKLLTAGTPGARKAATGIVSRVRIGDGTAFILFKPPGGTLSYFVMQDEDGAWKATSLAAGTPLSP